MSYETLLDVVKTVGLPGAILFWVLFINGQNQRDMLNQMRGIERAITRLTVSVHDALIYMKAKGGE